MKRNTALPYVSFAAFLSALDHLRSSPIDIVISSDECGDLAPSSWGQLSRSLHALKLIDEDSRPTASLRSLVTAVDRKPLIRKLLKARYPQLTEDLSRVRLATFEKRLAKSPFSGETMRRARSFFLGAAKYSELELSTDVARVIRRRENRKARSSSPKRRLFKRPLDSKRGQIDNHEVSFQMSDFELSLRFSAAFADFDKPERERLYHIIDELLLLKRKQLHLKARGKDQLGGLQDLENDPDVAAVH